MPTMVSVSVLLEPRTLSNVCDCVRVVLPDLLLLFARTFVSRARVIVVSRLYTRAVVIANHHKHGALLCAAHRVVASFRGCIVFCFCRIVLLQACVYIGLYETRTAHISEFSVHINCSALPYALLQCGLQ